MTKVDETIDTLRFGNKVTVEIEGTFKSRSDSGIYIRTCGNRLEYVLIESIKSIHSITKAVEQFRPGQVVERFDQYGSGVRYTLSDEGFVSHNTGTLYPYDENGPLVLKDFTSDKFRLVEMP